MLEGKYCEKERIIKRRYHQKEIVITTKVPWLKIKMGRKILWEGNHFEEEQIVRKKSLWVLWKNNYFEKEDIIMRKFVGHFFEQESILKSFH